MNLILIFCCKKIMEKPGEKRYTAFRNPEMQVELAIVHYGLPGCAHGLGSVIADYSPLRQPCQNVHFGLINGEIIDLIGVPCDLVVNNYLLKCYIVIILFFRVHGGTSQFSTAASRFC